MLRNKRSCSLAAAVLAVCVLTLARQHGQHTTHQLACVSAEYNDADYYDDEDDEDDYEDYVISEDDEQAARHEAMQEAMGTDAAEVRQKGLDFAIAGDMDSAFAYFQRATELAPHDAGYWSDLGVTQMRMGLLDEAKSSFGISAHIRPSKLVDDNLKALQEHLDWRDHGKAPDRAKKQQDAKAAEDEEDMWSEDDDDEEEEEEEEPAGEVYLDKNNYKRVVTESDDVWLVEYYSGKCGSCQEFLPTWHDVSTSFRDLRAARVNIDEKAGLA